jgi:hypothetical protein
MRAAQNIYGNTLEDFFGSLVMFPNIVSQLEYQAADPLPQSSDIYTPNGAKTGQ